MACKRDLQNPVEMIPGVGDFDAHVGRWVDGFDYVHGGNGIGERNVNVTRLLEFCDKEDLCVANAWY